MSDVTLRDLIRAAHASGAPLSRQPGWTGAMYWEFWDEAADRRRATVRRHDDLWRVDMYSHYVATSDDMDHAIHVAMINPTIPEIIDAARMCGWHLAVDRGEAT